MRYYNDRKCFRNTSEESLGKYTTAVTSYRLTATRVNAKQWFGLQVFQLKPPTSSFPFTFFLVLAFLFEDVYGRVRLEIDLLQKKWRPLQEIRIASD